MKLQNKMTGILLAAAMVATLGVPAFASNGYTETEISLPSEVAKGGVITGFYVHGDGNMDLFTTQEKQDSRGQSPVSYHHFTSADAGKTWRTASVAWIGDNEPYDFAVDKNGEVFCLISGENYKTSGEISAETYPSTKLAKVSGNQTVAIPNAIFKNPAANYNTILNILKNGDVVLRGSPSKFASTQMFVCVVDGKTGKVKTEKKLNDFTPLTFTDGKVYGYENTVTKQTARSSESIPTGFVGYDLATDQKILSVAIDDTFAADTFGVITDMNGSIYSANEKGLFRLSAGASKFEKLRDASECGFYQNYVPMGVAENKGKIYVVARYSNDTDGNDPRNGMNEKLFIYSPT